MTVLRPVVHSMYKQTKTYTLASCISGITTDGNDMGIFSCSYLIDLDYGTYGTGWVKGNIRRWECTLTGIYDGIYLSACLSIYAGICG